MKTKLMALIFMVALTLVWSANAQEQEAPSQQEQSQQEKSNDNARPSEGGYLNDQSLVIENFSYFRKASPDGRGQQLEVFFDIVNAQEKTRNLAVTVVAFYEKDQTDNPMRKYIEYPKWRTVDLDKRLKNIVYFGSVPEVDKTTVNPEKKGDKEFPNFLEYVDYISKNPQNGLKVPLQGYKDAELKEEQAQHHNMISKSLRTSLFVRFLKGYDYFSDKNDFFNHIGVFVYDEDTQALVHRQFFYFTKPPRLF